jgi:hypothetical protein
VCVPAAAAARDDSPAASPEARPAVQFLKLTGGAAIAFGAHEAAHLMFDLAFGANPHLKKVNLGGIPFFAIAHRGDLSRRREYIISAAGFWSQYAGTELILSRRPNLRHQRAPVEKGLLAFHVVTSAGYGVVALLRAGPGERDTRGMAFGARMDERAIGGLILAPAILDAIRYTRPSARWVAWASRAAKLGTVALLLR